MDGHDPLSLSWPSGRLPGRQIAPWRTWKGFVPTPCESEQHWRASLALSAYLEAFLRNRGGKPNKQVSATHHCTEAAKPAVNSPSITTWMLSPHVNRSKTTKQAQNPNNTFINLITPGLLPVASSVLKDAIRPSIIPYVWGKRILSCEHRIRVSIHWRLPGSHRRRVLGFFRWTGSTFRGN